MNSISIHSRIGPNVTIGKNVYIGPGCIIGYEAEDKKHEGTTGALVIGDNVKIHGNVTIDAGTTETTTIGNGCYIMKGVHIGHDCQIGDNVTMSPHTLIGGRVTVMEGCNFGMGSIVHNRCVIGAYSMMGMGTIITKKTEVEPGYVWVGAPAKRLKMNSVGLSRNKVTTEELKKLKEQWELLRKK